VNLSDRLRGIVGGGAGAVPVVRPADEGASSSASGRARLPHLLATAATLGGTVAEQSAGACVVVDRHYGPDEPFGRERVGAIVERLRGGEGELALLGRAWPSAEGLRGTLCVLDLETTGLAGGAGTRAFLIGCALVAADGVRVRQFLMPGLEHERAQLEALDAWFKATARVATQPAPRDPPDTASLSLVTFNGRTFDVPLVETRYLYHRLSWPLDGVPHLDMLHMARRLWRDPSGITDCALTSLERRWGGVHRVGDVPGCEIPSRYFQYVRDGDARPLEAVLEHNRLDLLSTALLLARALRLLRHGPQAASGVGECLGLGRVYERAGAADEAAACYQWAAELAARVPVEAGLSAEVMRRLARAHRRAGRLAEAAAAWTDLLGVRQAPAAIRREARLALAIHHEHRSRDLEQARRLALEALDEGARGRGRAEAEHRLRRLERKLAVRVAGGLLDAPGDLS
jgi:uncharacterized protein YprB with RNaseH-like and TPR domain